MADASTPADRQIFVAAKRGSAGLAFAALIAGNIAIAFGPLLVRLADTGPMATGFWRLALAAPFLALIGWRAGFRPAGLPRGPLILLCLAGAAFAADIIAWHISIFQTKLGNATLLANCASLILALYGIAIARRIPSRAEGAAVLLAFGGAAMLMLQSFELSPRHFQGDLLSLLAGAFYTLYLLAMMRARESAESWMALAIASAVAALLILPVSLAAGEKVMPTDWTPLIILALSSQVVGQGLLTFALPHFSPLIIGLALLLQPALSALAGWWVFGEALTAMDLIGGVMVMAALVLVRLADKAKQE
jgi:drug/metabolite transporter (DMT)-like permease